MGVCKGGPTSGEAINHRCSHLRMTAEGSDPVVEIVDRNEENVGFHRHVGFGVRTSEAQHNQAEKEFLGDHSLFSIIGN